MKLNKLILNHYNRILQCFPPEEWEDRGTYWLSKSPQGTNIWHSCRKFRLTASNFGAAIGKSIFTSPLDIALDIANIKPKSFTDENKAVMKHGVDTEPKAREWYSHHFKVQVREVGLAVPKWEVRIGASVDGEVLGTNGIIEIKSPLEMYRPLQEHKKKIENGWKPPPFYHKHIWETHYAQMQGCMKITNKDWCDYIVYATKSNLCYTERIYFNEEYWDKILWPGIRNFLDNILEPLIKEAK